MKTVIDNQGEMFNEMYDKMNDDSIQRLIRVNENFGYDEEEEEDNEEEENNDDNEDTKRAFLTIIQKFDVSGREEIKAKFKASHQGREIDERYLEELLKHRHHVDDVNRKIFQRNIVALMRLEPFNLEELNKAIKNLADHGLLKAEIKRIPSSMTKASLGLLEEWLKN